VEEHLAALDQPRMMKTWRLSQANVLDVATSLASSLFNEGQPGLMLSAGGSGASPSSGSGPQPSSMRVIAESISEGQGTSQSSQASGSSGQSGVVNNLTLRTRVQATQTIQVTPNGPLLIPDTRLNTLTLLGTAEQISMAESMISILDRKVPQLVLEAALIEIREDAANQFGFASGSSSGNFSTGSNNIGSSFTNAIGRLSGNAGDNIMRFSTNPTSMHRGVYYQLNALINKNKAKMLANPTIITSSDNEAVISIVDEVIRSVTVTQGSFGGASSKTFNIGDAGIVLNILPKIGANKTISMRVRPIVTTLASTKTDLNGNVVTLLSKREALAQNVQVKDGETFVLAGLIHNTNTEAVLSNPLFASLPILGALARNTTSSKHRSEFVILITPHIVNDESDLASNSLKLPGGIQPANYSGANTSGNGMVPVSFTTNSDAAANALPPMAPVEVFNSATHADDPLEGKSLATPLRRPSGSLLPAEMLPAPERAKPKTSSLPTPKAPKVPKAPKPEKTEATFMPASTTSAGDNDMTDAQIRAIMEKFK
jgi:type II secretory pathway component GspD/PulD (secretin)